MDSLAFRGWLGADERVPDSGAVSDSGGGHRERPKQGQLDAHPGTARDRHLVAEPGPRARAHSGSNRGRDLQGRFQRQFRRVGKQCCCRHLGNELRFCRPVAVDGGSAVAFDVLHSVADITRAKALIGYEPITRFEDGLAEAVAAYRETFSGSSSDSSDGNAPGSL